MRPIFTCLSSDSVVKESCRDTIVKRGYLLGRIEHVAVVSFLFFCSRFRTWASFLHNVVYQAVKVGVLFFRIFPISGTRVESRGQPRSQYCMLLTIVF